MKKIPNHTLIVVTSHADEPEQNSRVGKSARGVAEDYPQFKDILLDDDFYYLDYSVGTYQVEIRYGSDSYDYLLEPEDTIQVFINQGYREAFVLAVLGNEALIEYQMPNHTTALVVVNPESGDPSIESWHVIRNVSYNRIPFKWLKAMNNINTLNQMIYKPQGGGIPETDFFQILFTKLGLGRLV